MKQTNFKAKVFALSTERNNISSNIVFTISKSIPIINFNSSGVVLCSNCAGPT
jgi:hypothetical protein